MPLLWPRSIDLNTRLSSPLSSPFLIIGGTAVTAIAIGTVITTMPGTGFSLASYLVEKLSVLIPWRSAGAGAGGVDSGRRLEGIELGQRSSGGGEVGELKKQIEEGKVREEENAKELERLRDEVDSLKRELLAVGSGDTVTEEEVVGMVGSLNRDILKVAKEVSEGCSTLIAVHRRRGVGAEGVSDEVREAMGGVGEILGGRMVDMLQSAEEAPVQMALQASMSAYTHWIISSWYFENPEDEHLLSEIYARVRETEEQTVSGRWRATTRTHLQRMLSSEPDLTIYMIDAFVNVMLTAGWHHDAGVLQEHLMERYSGLIGGVLKGAQRLNKVIGEGIKSCDLEALYIGPDVVFDAGTMDVSSGSGERVLCTSGLGLVRAEKRVGRVGEWDEGVLLRPVVVL